MMQFLLVLCETKIPKPVSSSGSLCLITEFDFLDQYMLFCQVLTSALIIDPADMLISYEEVLSITAALCYLHQPNKNDNHVTCWRNK